MKGVIRFIIALFKAMLEDTKATSDEVIDICIGLFLAGILLPTSLAYFNVGNFSGLNPAVQTVCVVLLPALGVIGIAMIYVKKLRHRG